MPDLDELKKVEPTADEEVLSEGGSGWDLIRTQDTKRDEEPAQASVPADTEVVLPEGPAAPSWETLLADVSPEEIIARHHGLQQHMSGKIGELAQQQARRMAEADRPQTEAQIRHEIRLEEQARREADEDAELERLRTEDPLAFADRYGTIRQRRAAEAQRRVDEHERTRGTQAYGDQLTAAAKRRYDEEVLKPLARLLSPEDAAEFSARTYEDTERGRGQYVLDVNARLALRSQEKERAAGQKAWAAREAAVRKELLGEANVGAQPDIGGGRATSGNGALTYEGYEAMSWEDRTRLKRDQPELVNAMWRTFAARR